MAYQPVFDPTELANLAKSTNNFTNKPTISQSYSSAFNPTELANTAKVTNNFTTKPVQPTTPTAPTTPTTTDSGNIESLYGGYNTADDIRSDKLGASLETLANTPVDENAIFQRMNDRFQKEIDVVNQIYAEKLAREKVATRGNIGTVGAIAGRSGTLGSTFGASQIAQTEEAGRQAEQGIMAEQAAEINKIYGLASQKAVEEIKAKNEARKEGTQAYISYINNQSKSKAVKVGELVGSLVGKNIDIKNVDLDRLAQAYGVTPTSIESAYYDEKAKADKMQSESELALAKAQPQSVQEYEYAKATGYTGTYNEYQNLDANRKAIIARAGVSNGQFGLSSGQTGNLLSITNKFQADPIMKAANQGYTAISVADRVLKDPNNAGGQLSILYTLVKSLDPDSAVREGEVGLAQTTQSFLGKFGTNLQRIYEGKPISAAAAKTLAEETKKLAQAWYSAGQIRESQYKSQAQTVGLGDPFNAYLGGYQRPYTQTDTPQSDTVTIVTPDGRTGTIPRANLNSAIQKGAKLAQ